MAELSHAELERLLASKRRPSSFAWLLVLAIWTAWAVASDGCGLETNPAGHRTDPGVTVVSQPVPRSWHEIAPADAGDTRLPKAEDAGE